MMALGLLLGTVPASGQTDPKSGKKEQTASGAATVKAFHTPRIRFGGFTFGAGYSRFSGRFPFYPFYPYSYYAPWYYDNFYPYYYGAYSPLWYHSGWYTGFARGPYMGEVKLRSNIQDAEVFLNDGFAGKIKDLKTVWLDPGVYDLKIQADSYAPYTVRIYVLSGKTLKVDARLAPQKEP